ncbi:MAG: hypothetical protein LBF84_02330 [Holosporales bacterium]|jgi:hypothetical protein|nr:hypothetical protein [Holosporales bacterium]
MSIVSYSSGGSNSKVVFTRSSFVGKLIKPAVPFCDAKPAKAGVSAADQRRDKEAEELGKKEVVVSAVVLDGQQIRSEIPGLTPGVPETDGPGPGTEIQENQGNQENTDGPGPGTEIQENQGNQENTDGPGPGTEIQENQEVVLSGLSFAPEVLPSEIRMVRQHVNASTSGIPQKESRNYTQSRPNFRPTITPRMTKCPENRATGPPKSCSIYSFTTEHPRAI